MLLKVMAAIMMVIVIERIERRSELGCDHGHLFGEMEMIAGLPNRL